MAARCIPDERRQIKAIARTELNLAAAQAAQRDAEGTNNVYPQSIQRIRELVRFGTACAEQGDHPAAQECLSVARELIASLRARLDTTTGQDATQLRLTAIERDIDLLEADS